MEFVRLHPVPDERGVNRFDPADLEGLEPRAAAPARPRQGLSDQEREYARKGRLAAQVFRLFARGAELPQVVVATKQPPERIRELATRLDVQEMAVVTWAYDEAVRHTSYRLLAEAMGLGADPSSRKSSPEGARLSGTS